MCSCGECALSHPTRHITCSDLLTGAMSFAFREWKLISAKSSFSTVRYFRINSIGLYSANLLRQRGF